jgi:diguanylate cyclase (GGDEF)-like protein/PAS domain S-box-containing protein
MWVTMVAWMLLAALAIAVATAWALRARCRVGGVLTRTGALYQSENPYRVAVEGAMDAIVVLDDEGRISYANPAVAATFGYAPEALVGVPVDSLVPGVGAWSLGPCEAPTRDDQRVERLSGVHRDGRPLTLEARFGKHVERGQVVVTGVMRDVTEHGELEQQLRSLEERYRHAEARLVHHARHDSLTGQPNRVLFSDYLSHCLARVRHQGEQPCAVLLVDLDRFKNVNDSLGHAIGDRFLSEVAERLDACVRPGDMVARLGGDEFAILLERVADAKIATDLAECVLLALSHGIRLGEHEVVPSASVGVVLGSADYDGVDALMRDADVAMYRAKELGKGRYELFHARLQGHAETRLRLEAELRRAIDEDRIEVAYQPIVSLATGRTSGFEALARWARNGRDVPPAEFIPIAEETGLVGALERRVIRRALDQLAEWQRSFALPTPLSVNLNLSGRHLDDADLPDFLRRGLEAAGLAAGSVRLEITESWLMKDDAATQELLSELKRIGFKLAIDDFGTGYSSLSYLHRLPVDVVKLDRSFVCEMESSAQRSAIVETMVNLAKQLSLDVVAEGVESVSQIDSLRRFGCDLAQGFFFSQPVDATAAGKLLAREIDVLDGHARAEQAAGSERSGPATSQRLEKRSKRAPRLVA